MKVRGIQSGAWRRNVARLASAVLLLVSSIASAACEVRDEVVLGNLRSPSGVAIRSTPGAENYEIYVAEVGAGRIVRLDSSTPNVSEEAVTGFVASTDEDGLIRLPGPHGLLFLDSNRLVVTGSEGQTRPFVRLYELGDPKQPLSAEQHEEQAEPASGEEPAVDGVAGFRGIVRTKANDKVPDFIALTAIRDDREASLWRLPVRSGTLGDLKPLDGDQPSASPVAIAVEPRGYIVVVRPEEHEGTSTSHIEFVSPIDGRVAARFSIKLGNVVGVAYSPRTGNLYAISQSSSVAGREGVFRIDTNQFGPPSELSATATHVAQVQRPTALAFGPDAALYVTSLGGDRKSGSLHKITGAF
jgi:hypothetical protein